MTWRTRLLLVGWGAIVAGVPVYADAPPSPYDANVAETRQLQSAESVVPRWMRDRSGRPDWMKMLGASFIKPRDSLKAETAPGGVLDLDIVMKNTKLMPWVKFPHRAHTEWLDCANCHDSIFVARAGANKIDMNRIIRGEACGVCHGRVAFQPLVACERCHNIAQGNIPAWWIK